MSGWHHRLRPLNWLRRLWLEWLTPSSKIAILAIIASLNAVWGYPLVGLLASLLTLLVIAAIVNWLLRPRLTATMRLPSLVAAYSELVIDVLIENRSITPAFDLTLSLTTLPRGWKIVSGRCNVSQLNPRESATVSYTLQVAGRGEFQWPVLRCESSFPFSLFRSRQDIDFKSETSRGTRIWVSPAIIESEVPAQIQSLMTRGQLCEGLRAGESLEYLGSREYCYGDFVRRWDFASWARLGRPIARQFDQSSTGNLTIVVDMLIGSKPTASTLHDFETRLSLAASVIHSLQHTACQIRLILPSVDDINSAYADHTQQDILLRPLAMTMGLRADYYVPVSDPSDRKTCDRGWRKVASQLRPDETLICIMGSVINRRSNEQNHLIDHDRRDFTAIVTSFPSAIIVGAEKLAGLGAFA